MTHSNLSDVFEYPTPGQAAAPFVRIADAVAPSARRAYWCRAYRDVLADRQLGAALRHRRVRLDALADRLRAVGRAAA